MRKLLLMSAVVPMCLLALGTSPLAALSKPKAKTPAPTTVITSTKPGEATTSSAPGPLSTAYNAYIGRLRQKIDNKWYLADGKNLVTLAVSVAPDGSVTGLTITSVPGNTQAEQAASDAFNGCQPLEPLPSGSPPIKLTLTFDSFADPHGDSNRSISGRIDPEAQPTASQPVQDNSSQPTTSGSNAQQ